MDGFIEKHGAIFTRDEGVVRFPFAEAGRTDFTYAWQVPRADFDQRFRTMAENNGVRFHFAKVEDVELPGKVHTSEGTIHCKTFIDAGGRSQTLARKLGIRRPIEALKNIAMGAWHKNVRTFEPEERGDIVIAAWPGGWFWLIPFENGITSVGTVIQPSAGITGSVEERFAEAVRRCPAAQARLEGAERIVDFQGLQDWSAKCPPYRGDGWILAGDAGLFIDPIFSSGVMLGLESASRLSRVILGDPAYSWDQYLAEVEQASTAFERAVLSFYDGTFLDVALSPRELHQPGIRAAIISLLAGDVWDLKYKTPWKVAGLLPEIARRVNSQA
jgi:flavin-dependent dehydrogenase